MARFLADVLCHSHEGAFRYFSILALTDSPQRNIAEVECLVLDEQMLKSSLSNEIGTLLNAAFLYLDEQVQDAVLSAILTLREDENIEERPWILEARIELLSAIPTHLRSPEAQSTLVSWESTFGPYVREAKISFRCGWVTSPFSYEQFLNCTDASVLRILSHYQEDGRCDWEHDNLVGGAQEVESQLRETASRSPTRFLYILAKHWADIPDRFSDDILDGVATYLAHRHGHLQFDANKWVPLEEPDPQGLASSILDEIERHTTYWHHCRAAAKALEACANVIQDEHDASRLLFSTIGFANCQEHIGDGENDTRDLISVGINMSRGDVAEAVMIIATHWVENRRVFPELLAPTLKRFALDSHPAVRALILHRLPYFQSLSAELGWEIFHLALRNDDERLWVAAEPCLYYAYNNRFPEVSRILNHIVSTATGKALDTWGRISALATLSGHVDLADFVSQLQSHRNTNAWEGATSVWSHNENAAQHSEQCFLGIRAGLQQEASIASSVAREMASLFRKDEPIIIVPADVVDLYYTAIEQDQSEDHFDLHGLEDWLNAISQHKPDEALTITERFSDFIRRSKHPIYDHEALSQLLTRLFREAEEREEADSGVMLYRVIAVQDKVLEIGVTGLQDWLRDAERP